MDTLQSSSALPHTGLQANKDQYEPKVRSSLPKLLSLEDGPKQARTVTDTLKAIVRSRRAASAFTALCEQQAPQAAAQTPSTGAVFGPKPIGKDFLENLWDRIRTSIYVFVHTNLEIILPVAVEDYLSKPLPQILEHQEFDMSSTVTRTVMTQLQPSVDLLGSPHGCAQPPLPGE